MRGIAAKFVPRVLTETKCESVYGMDDKAVIPDSAIKLYPAGNASDIRLSGQGWKTNTTENRIIYIDIGDDLNNGGEVYLVKSKNVEIYQVVLFGKVKEPESEVSVIPERVVSPLLTPTEAFSIKPGTGKTKIQLTIVATTKEIPMVVTVSVKICVKPTTYIPTTVSSSILSSQETISTSTITLSKSTLTSLISSTKATRSTISSKTTTVPSTTTALTTTSASKSTTIAPTTSTVPSTTAAPTTKTTVKSTTIAPTTSAVPSTTTAPTTTTTVKSTTTAPMTSAVPSTATAPTTTMLHYPPPLPQLQQLL
ncbi:uncharacterized protein LOC106867630 [Octopus bimaculoides]|nr:uncharacterized protein LOC106867630 [Octopus bimaculoides]